MLDLLRLLCILALVAAVLFLAAGTWELPFFWAYLAVVAVVALTALRTIDPRLKRERVRLDRGRNYYLLRLFLLPFVLGHWVVAGLDVGRFHWSGTVPWLVQVAGLVFLAGSFAFVAAAMRANRFFSPAVRIQEEEGHHIIDVGPYAFVRHPGYLGMMLAFLASGPALGSWWAILPTLGYAAVLLVRTAREDRFLQANLPGYREYAQRIRYRLLPGIW